jgi:glycosyltransferase involved in cell wall biosynthesis
MSIHIIIPNYNKQKFIKKTVESVVNQSYQDWILTIVDNNSEDKSVTIIQKAFPKLIKQKKINIICHQKFVSQGQNWNRCLKVIGNHKYYKILCSDDTLAKDHIKNAIKCLDSSDEKIFAYACNIFYINEMDSVIGQRKYGFYGLEFWLSLFFRNMIGTPSSTVMKTEFYNNYKFTEVPYIGDLLVYMNYYLEKKRVFFSKHYEVNFRISSFSDTNLNYGTQNMLIGRKYLRKNIIHKLQINYIFKNLLKIAHILISVFEIIFFTARQLIFKFNFSKKNKK